MVAPNIGTQLWIKSLNLSIVDEWRPWWIDDQVGEQTYPMVVLMHVTMLSSFASCDCLDFYANSQGILKPTHICYRKGKSAIQP